MRGHLSQAMVRESYVYTNVGMGVEKYITPGSGYKQLSYQRKSVDSRVLKKRPLLIHRSYQGPWPQAWEGSGTLKSHRNASRFPGHN